MSSSMAGAAPDPELPPSGGLALTVGERYPVGEREYTLTPRLAEAVVRGQPLLAALVINRAEGEVGTDDDAWAPPERTPCWEYWVQG